MDANDRLDPDNHDATGPDIQDDSVTCSTCHQPVWVWSPDFDSAMLLHGEPWVS